jgi:hypothetical protein
LLRGRIKLPDGYRLEVFARDLGRPRLMQMTANGDLIVSGYRDGTILLVKADIDGDGRSDWQGSLREALNQPHGPLLEEPTLYVAEEQRVVSYDFDGVTLDKERVISTWRLAQAAIPASKNNPGAPGLSASRKALPLKSLPQACATRWALTGSQGLARFSALLTAVTIWVMIFPTTR